MDLNAKAIASLKKQHGKSQLINYKDAVNQLTIDLDKAAGNDPDARDGEMHWTVFGLNPIRADNVEQLASN